MFTIINDGGDWRRGDMARVMYALRGCQGVVTTVMRAQHPHGIIRQRTRAHNIDDVHVKPEAYRRHHDTECAGLTITPALKMV
jgi:hypothetical protein